MLIERFNKDGKLLKGRTRCWKKVIFEGKANMIGTLQPVKVHSLSHETLRGDLLRTGNDLGLKVI